MGTNPNEFLPLAPATLHILLALSDQDRHGYGIMQEVRAQSDGRYRLGPGTLYDNLSKLLNQGLIEETGRKSSEDARRRYYRLTSNGREVAALEIKRLESMFRKAKPHLKEGTV